ncbi:Lipid-translocating exporter-like protein RTA1 [Paramyrothecium foliicola]|nr:Lipid-translocating exporter-like protein RTA1 [Paramyrothecium foliicola]
MSNGEYVPGSYYFYAPNKGAAIFFAIAFLTSGLVHVWQNVRYKSWLLTPLWPFCSLLFTAGFTLRIYGAFHYDNLNMFIASICITYGAPPMLELQNYHVLGRILYYVPYHAPLHPGRVLTTFGFISAIVESLNGWGASLSSNQGLPDSQIELGHALTKASLLIQIFVVTSFFVLSITFHRACRKHGLRAKKLQTPLITLYISTTLILGRTIFRIVEYFGIAQIRYDDPDLDPWTISPAIRYEWYFYVFEALLMLTNNVLCNARHPRMFLPKSNKIYLAPDGETEVEGPGLKDPRPFWQTLVDPFDIAGLVSGKGAYRERFWETHEGGPARAEAATGKAMAPTKHGGSAV